MEEYGNRKVLLIRTDDAFSSIKDEPFTLIHPHHRRIDPNRPLTEPFGIG
jgi:hypothetical protein